MTRAVFRVTRRATRTAPAAAFGVPSILGVAIALLAPATSAIAQDVDRSTPPVVETPPRVKLPPIAVRQLPNGLTLMIAERHDVPVADFMLIVPTGAAANPAGKAGAAELAAAMLKEGTPSRTSLQIDDQAAFLGAKLETATTWDATIVSLTTPKAQLDSALALFADVALHPAFSPAEFERAKRGRLTELVQLRDRVPVIADRAYASILYGANHPYGQPLYGTEQSVGGLTADDAKKFYTSYFSPNGATLVVVGDVTPDDVERRIGALFGDWKSGSAVPDEVADLSRPPTPTTIYLIDKPGATRTAFRIGTVGVARSRPDYFPIQVMNLILGGSPTSRLVRNLRDTKRYAYDVESEFDMRRAAGPFLVRAEVVSSKADSALAEFIKELRAIRSDPPDSELTQAKTHLQYQFQGTFESNADIVQQLAVVGLYGRPHDYYDYFDNYFSRVAAVRSGDVQRVARQYVDAEHLVVVIVGDRKSLEPKLKALNAGSVLVRDVNGNPVK